MHSSTSQVQSLQTLEENRVSGQPHTDRTPVPLSETTTGLDAPSKHTAKPLPWHSMLHSHLSKSTKSRLISSHRVLVFCCCFPRQESPALEIHSSRKQLLHLLNFQNCGKAYVFLNVPGKKRVVC